MSTEIVLAPFALPVWATALLFGILGGLLAALLTRVAMSQCGEADRGWSTRAGLAAALLCGYFTWAMLTWKCQETPVVRPSEIWWHWRIGYHLVLIALLVAATATDLRAYLIPDFITACGLLFGVTLAFLSGDLQVEHVWVDWNQEIPQLRQAYIPEWISLYPHLHGLAWSLTGAFVAAGGTWLIRAVSSFVMGRESMGLGDVTLMAMIGSFLGWQPVVMVLLFAPLCAITGMAAAFVLRAVRTRIAGAAAVGNVRPYLPFGPFLCISTYIVLCAWRWLWMWELPLGRTTGPFTVRKLFGDWLSLAIIAGATISGLTILLVLRRAYQKIPVTRREREQIARSEDAGSEIG
jgi:leader peptidase (prepilin peptidase)/N-methyltransferase